MSNQVEGTAKETGWKIPVAQDGTTNLRNIDWNITPGPDGKIPDDQVAHILLIDIREAARSLRKMCLFFTVLAIINCVAFGLWLVNAVTK